MKLFKKINDIQRFVKITKAMGHSVGFVPTMGALHDGHLSLIEASQKKSDITICSIFVNPTQFNNQNDLAKYPRTIEKDLQALLVAGCDVVFLPGVNEIYPPGQAISHAYDLGMLDRVFEGAYRPGHFQGVCQVVDRLFRIVQPEHVFFGQKDYQQCQVINRLIEITPAFSHLKRHIIPTMREANGLAMSSRNMRLAPQERELASVINRTLLFLKNSIKPGDVTAAVRDAKKKLEDAGLQADYLSIAEAGSLREISIWDGNTPLVALVAAYLGEVRLIDNLLLTD